MSISVVALVPMRHSSERVPGKNYRSFNGKPLFHHIVEMLLEVKHVERIVIDTDSDTVRKQCETHFPMVACIDRPAHLLGGDVPMTRILQHDAAVFPSEWYLQTHSTNPLLTSETVERALDALAVDEHGHDSILGVTRLHTRLFDSQGRPINHDPDVLLRTQDLPPIFEENSNLYVFRNDQIQRGRRTGVAPYLFEIDALEAIDIDEESDFIIAEAVQRLKLGSA